MRKRPGRAGSRKTGVPNLSGLTRSQARAALEAAGLVYSESSQETNTLGLDLLVNTQGISSGTVANIGSTVSFVYYNYVAPAPVITYGPCESYGTGTNVGSGTQCSGTYTEAYIDYSYNTRKKVYSDGAWDGTTYSTAGCVATTSRTVTSTSQVNGQCGYTTPPVITYGACEAYGSGTNAGSGTQCSGNYYQSYTDYTYNTRKKIYSDGVWDGSSYSTSGCGTTTERTVNSSSQVDGQCGYTAPPTITYGACEAYGSGTNIGSGSYCSGTTTVYYTDYRYNARKKIYVNGSWDGSSYTTSGCSTVDSRSITSSGQVDGLCGYTNPISYGSCQAYGSVLYPVSSGTQCSGTYYQNYTVNAYNARRTILVNGSWDGSSYDTSSCGQIFQTDITSSSQIDGSCGYTAPAPAAQWYCTESYNGGGVGNCGYTMPGYNNSASGSGYSRQCTFGYAYPGCQSTNPYTPPPTCTSYKYNCKSYDVTNSASVNYYQCYTVGECAANYNSDGSRTSCCASYG